MFGRTSIRFLVSNALSLLGNSIAAVALPLILLATTGDALAAGTLALICAVPQMAIGIVGGAALDRLEAEVAVQLLEPFGVAIEVAGQPVLVGVFQKRRAAVDAGVVQQNIQMPVDINDFRDDLVGQRFSRFR